MTCHVCGHANAGQARFCARCGTSLAEEPVHVITAEIEAPAIPKPPPAESKLRSTVRTAPSASSPAAPPAPRLAAASSLFAPPTPTAAPVTAAPVTVVTPPPAPLAEPAPPPRHEPRPPDDPDADEVDLPVVDVIALLGRVGFLHTATIGNVCRLEASLGMVQLDMDEDHTHVRWVAHDPERLAGVVTWFRHEVGSHLLHTGSAAATFEAVGSTAPPAPPMPPVDLTGGPGQAPAPLPFALPSQYTPGAPPSPVAPDADSRRGPDAAAFTAAPPINSVQAPAPAGSIGSAALSPAAGADSDVTPSGVGHATATEVDVKRVFELSEQAVPAFARIGRKQPEAAGNYDPLQISWAEKNFPVANRPGEHVLTRVSLLTCSLVVGVDGASRPIANADHESVVNAVTVCSGAGLAIVTNERLLGMLFLGETPFGELSATSNILFSLELHDVVRLAMLRKKGVLAYKETGLQIDAIGSGRLTLEVDRRIDDDRFAHRITYPEFMRTLVEATVGRLRFAKLGDIGLIAEAEGGQYQQDGDLLTARFYT